MQIREEKEQSVEVILTAHEAAQIARDILANPKTAGPGAVALAELLQKEGFTAAKTQAPTIMSGRRRMIWSKTSSAHMRRCPPIQNIAPQAEPGRGVVRR